MKKRQLSGTTMMTRRHLLERGLYGAAGLGLMPMLKGGSCAAANPPRAASIIQIWMWGGPCHIDTFDPKPDAGEAYCGPFDKAVATNVDGIQISDQLPLLARQADKYAIIRSMTHGINAHETASYRVQTGHEPGQRVYPNVGAVVSLFKGYDYGYEALVPPYIVLTESQGRFSEAGFLGQKYRPFITGGDPNQNPFAVEGIVARGISDKRQRDRRRLRRQLDTLGNQMPNHPEFQTLDAQEANAYDIMFGDARKLFDLSNESDEIRQRYGRNTFGQSCLMARRLVEHGVPYITINYKGWDTHKQHFETMRRKLPEMDKAMSALLVDLVDRGLLDSTIVWWSGEFGRTPRIQWQAPWNGGRGHYGRCFSAVVAGGGFKGGRVLGASNDNGTEVIERPVDPKELIATMYSLLGIDPNGKLPNTQGLDLQVMPTSPGRGLLSEII